LPGLEYGRVRTRAAHPDGPGGGIEKIQLGVHPPAASARNHVHRVE